METVVAAQRQWTGGKTTSLLQSEALCVDAQEQAIRLRNQQRIAEALAREPDWEKLKEGYKIVEELRQEAANAGVTDISLEQMNAIIAECRREMWQEQK